MKELADWLQHYHQHHKFGYYFLREQAQRIALLQAVTEAKTSQLKVASSTKYILNLKLSGLGNDEKNHLVSDIFIVYDGFPQTFANHFFVDLTSGKIIYEKPEIVEALSRDIQSCAGNANCPTVRSEGGPATGDADTDTVYGFFSDVYNFYKNTFGRDSYDGHGVTMVGVVHYPGDANFKCPNAAWDGQEMVYCTGMIAKDVTGHELTHAVEHTVLTGMGGTNEIGSLDESIADIFGSAQDGNWTMGENLPTNIGIPVPLRNLADPSQSKEKSGGEPDKLFAANFYCGSQDSGGRHLNSSVFSKAFFLMTDGGNFNSCSISGQGRQKTNAIMYKALTQYLSPTSNFKDAYRAMSQACSDLYQSNSDTCANVQKAMMATELDQQPDGQPDGPFCHQIQEKQPNCGSVTTGPTETPDPNKPTNTPTPTVAPTAGLTPGAGGSNASLKVTIYFDKNNNGKYDGPSEGADKILVLLNKGTSQYLSGQTGSDGVYIFPKVDYGNNYTLTLETSSLVIKTITIVTAIDKQQLFTMSPIAITQSQLTPTATPVPATVTPQPTSGGSPGSNNTPSDTPTPTPIHFSCRPDPSCVASGSNIQLCKLICTQK